MLISDRASRKATLAISALVHSYCRVHEDCGEHQEVRDIISVFDDNLRYNCKTTTDDLHDKVQLTMTKDAHSGNKHIYLLVALFYCDVFCDHFSLVITVLFLHIIWIILNHLLTENVCGIKLCFMPTAAIF